ncbi:MAG: chemotaxis protein CheW [Rhodocyclaceae bacterium]|nr:chemotaxis protein CheW [Rhodocyclaceae bacterium]
MSIDMSQFYQVFFEEAQEHLASMESLLLDLDVANPDPEQLNAIFRAAHSIKGSSGTFGFTDLQDVTHILENLLDRIRKSELALRSEMIDAFLDAGDVLKGLLAAHRGEGPADPSQVATICARLKQLTADEGSAGDVSAVVAKGKAAAGSDSWRVSFIIDQTGDAAATTVENLVAELAAHWPVRIVGRPAAAGGRWTLEVGVAADPEIVRGMLDFVARSDSIRIGDTASADDAGGAFGFFDNDSGAVAGSSAPADEGFGFFDDLPEVPGAAATPVAEVAAAPATDPGYGFFTDEPVPVSAAVSGTPKLAASAGSEGDGFGFFVDVPAPQAATVAAVAAVAAVATAQEASSGASVSAPATMAASKAHGESDKPAVDRRAKAEAGDTTIRVGVDKVDQLINLVGELVITQAMLAQSAQGVDPVVFERLHNGLAQLERNTRDLQETVMSIRMMPMSVVFSRFPRVVRDLSQKLGKKVELKTSGESTELDKSLIERITDPLTHLIRNSLDHGIEMPEDRQAKGKQEIGTITLKAYQQSGNIVIEVGDDGAGLNRDKILSKAKEKGLPVHDQMSDADVWMLIFEAGFSTADQITEVSGRGVGMDVVKRNIAAMGGRVEISSMTGIGTRMTVKLPLTLAILDGMSVAAGKETYIIPLGYVIESLQAEKGMIKSVSGVEKLVQVRDEYLPVIALYELFKIPGTITRLDEGILIVVEVDGTKAALFVDSLVGQHQVVIKSLEANYRKVNGIGGATIMGDGHVALILDVVALVQMARSTLPSLSKAA